MLIKVKISKRNYKASLRRKTIGINNLFNIYAGTTNPINTVMQKLIELPYRRIVVLVFDMSFMLNRFQLTHKFSCDIQRPERESFFNMMPSDTM